MKGMATARGVVVASAGVLLAAAGWGLFWIPLRSLDAHGIEGVWSTFVLFVIGALAMAPALAWRAGAIGHGNGRFLVTGLFSGGAWILYTNSLLLTDVVRALLLFYLTPLWSTLFVRLVHREAIAPARWLAVVLAIGGLAAILGVDAGFPLPRNLGDWMGLLSGMVWAYASVRIRREPEAGAIEGVAAFFLGGGLLAALSLLLPFEAFGSAPTWGAVVDRAPTMALLAVGFIVPSMLLIVGGARRLSPVRVGILLMTEAVVGAFSAALLTAEPFGAREALGAGLILGAGVIDVLAAGDGSGSAARAAAGP
jgi:drug/metabolite transporter (DMT)-like permease